MKLILFAHIDEARETITQLDARPCENSKRWIWNAGVIPTLYRFSTGTIVISNIGMHAATAALASYHHGHDEVWNIGFAGALHPRLSLMEIVPIRQLAKLLPHLPRNPHLAEAAFPPLHLNSSGYRLLSSDLPIHCQHDLAEQHDLVDMEGYGIAHLAIHLNMPCKIWKIVSDFASEGGNALIAQHKHLLSQKISSHVTDQLKHLYINGN